MRSLVEQLPPQKDLHNVFSIAPLSSLASKTADTMTAKLLHSGWYYPTCSKEQSRQMLDTHPLGTFLVRNSSCSKYPYTLSVKTAYGVANIRVCFLGSEKQMYHLDCISEISHKMACSLCVLDLIERLVTTSALRQCNFMDNAGNRDLKLYLRTPLKKNPSSLKHLCRLTVNRHISQNPSVQRIALAHHLPKELCDYLSEYRCCI